MGCIGIIIKKDNGTQIHMNRDTNIIDYYFNNASLYQGNIEEWYKAFSSNWNIMLKDYEKNADSGEFEENLTAVYLPHAYACPIEFGIIAVDLKNKKIYSSQDFIPIGNDKIMKDSQWEIVSYNNRDMGILHIKKYLDENGFKFTSEDNIAWTKYLATKWYGFQDYELENDPFYEEFTQLYQKVFKKKWILIEED